ncbi:MAG TPA: transposase [Gemmataceae bacterium]|nr:transposase [Gemmataceae bacterium]
MIFGYHVIFGVYGFWLPNDPRGSWSDFVGSWELFRFGAATTTDTRQSVAHQPHDRQQRRAARDALPYPPVCFSGLQARAVGRGFASFVEKSQITIWACAILPEHMHLVAARQEYEVEQLVNLLKGAATRQLLAERLHPFAELRSKNGTIPKCWARGLWKVFLDSDTDIVRAVRYVEQNPSKEGKPAQHWSFVTPFPTIDSPAVV